MTIDTLKPSLDLLRQDFVLVQAWKKTANYIRYHNWYVDTLDLDRTTVNLPQFIANTAKSIRSDEQWESNPLRIVPAPKSQRWQLSSDSQVWGPIDKHTSATPLRPLAHVSLRDQVVATAVMLCLANRVETRQGDPRGPNEAVSSYGNRLFCDAIQNELRHRWGSVKLYRSYFADYRSFLSRPSDIAESIKQAGNQRVFIVDSDLSQFYDRVRPETLMDALRGLQLVDDDPAFFDFAAKVFNWQWDVSDKKVVADYKKSVQLADFDRVALPQGLVSAGFFSNVVLIDFDHALRKQIGEEVAPGVVVRDVCRYVDDLRVVVSTDHSHGVKDVKQTVASWLNRVLSGEAAGLQISAKKTNVAEFAGAERPYVRQSGRMDRIQTAVSGGFDAIDGVAILDALQGLMQSQSALRREAAESGWQLAPLPDVRDETVARFSAGRFRSTYRSIRPLFEEISPRSSDEVKSLREPRMHGLRKGLLRSRQDLDEDARTFALGLIQRWIEDPSNVRLLRIGLDIWPDVNVLEEVLRLLRPFTSGHSRCRAARRVADYCLSELFRAGATETGLVEDHESLPAEINIREYQEVLIKEAASLLSEAGRSTPWYLQQQALLLLATLDPRSAPGSRRGLSAATRHYRDLIDFMRGEHRHLTAPQFATQAILIRRSFFDHTGSLGAVRQHLTRRRRREIGVRDPSFALELMTDNENLPNDQAHQQRFQLQFAERHAQTDYQSLQNIVLTQGPTGSLRNELSMLMFSEALLDRLQDLHDAKPIIPSQVELLLHADGGFPGDVEIASTKGLKMVSGKLDWYAFLYAPPAWCDRDQRWRFKLGFLLRFVLTGQLDFTNTVRRTISEGQASAPYRQVKSHWYQRIYGLFNGQKAFGDDWLPISDWMEQFVSALLSWPGCRTPSEFEWVFDGMQVARARIRNRIDCVKRKRGASTGALMLSIRTGQTTSEASFFRACVVQTVVPTVDDFDDNDLTLSRRKIRRKHRNHLSAALAGVRRMLDLRSTHMEDGGALDLLILPELAVHPQDVKTHLIPFARSHRTVILAGLTYQHLVHGSPPVNSALWIIPEWSSTHGLQIRTLRQGKRHLAPIEQSLNVQGFRPCQWLVGFVWSDRRRPLWLTASVCYDATDLGLAADLSSLSDIFLIPAFNKDVKTFDQMALALHYHMFQLVVVANNGRYGGSNAYWPLHEEYEKQIFHLHGQPQASIAFLEIDDIAGFLARGESKTENGSSGRSELWKSPPAGW